MNINSDAIVSMTEANQNFSKVAKMADSHGEVIIFKNNKPRYRLVDLEQHQNELSLTEDEMIDVVAQRVLKKYHAAFEELAK